MNVRCFCQPFGHLHAGRFVISKGIVNRGIFNPNQPKSPPSLIGGMVGEVLSLADDE